MEKREFREGRGSAELIRHNRRQGGYLDILVFQLVDQNRDRIETVVRIGVTRCHFAAGHYSDSVTLVGDRCRVRCVYVDARVSGDTDRTTFLGHARVITA